MPRRQKLVFQLSNPESCSERAALQQYCCCCSCCCSCCCCCCCSWCCRCRCCCCCFCCCCWFWATVKRATEPQSSTTLVKFLEGFALQHPAASSRNLFEVGAAFACRLSLSLSLSLPAYEYAPLFRVCAECCSLHSASFRFVRLQFLHDVRG